MSESKLVRIDLAWVIHDTVRKFAGYDLARISEEAASALLASPVVAQMLADAKAEAWDFGYACGLGDCGKSDDETQAANPYRTEGEQPIDWTRLHHGICPKCREDKFIGHGPLCPDCYFTSGQEPT